MARILDRLEGAAKWVTDPKQILTAAGFMLGNVVPGGGVVGAGIGRTIGGMIPQPWGDRKSSFEGSGDIGRFAGDFASGYSAGTIGQHVPRISNLEGSLARAFGGGDAMSAVAPPPGGPSTGVSPQVANVPAGNRYWATHADSMPTRAGAPLPLQSQGGAGPSSYEQMRALDPGSVVRRSELQGGANPFQNTAPLQSQGGGVSPFQNTAPLQSQGGGVSPFQAGLNSQLPQVPSTRALEFTSSHKPEVSGDGGLLGDLGLGDLGPLERMYMVSQLASGLGTAFGGPENIGPAPSSWGPRPSFRYEGFDDWRSRRNI